MNVILKIVLGSTLFYSTEINAQTKGLVNTSNSGHAKLASVNMADVQWTNGFWAERFNVCRDSMLPNIWRIYNDANISHAFKNFEIAAGLDTGSHKGPSFHDGDFYKTLEAMASMYAATKDKRLDEQMDKAITVIAKAQREDGYIYTKAAIEQQQTGEKKQFEDRLSFEAYNIGHLMTAACVHYRATGKSNLLDVARKATDYLDRFYQRVSPEIARNAICPSHYMGTIEMYRTTGDARYKALAQKLIDIRGISTGSDDNSDRYKFREMKEVVGHAVRANYLFAGVADVYAETGDHTLLKTLNVMWDDVVNNKMYITGGCGALHDGVSNDGTSFNPNDVEKLHQAYGRKFQLPNYTAHNETCANIGNVLWNWRMLQLTGDVKYADVMELALYNSVLSGVSLNGKKFHYTNPLAYSEALPFKQRWTKESYATLNAPGDKEKFGNVGEKPTWSRDRIDYISVSNCCPPNVVRTIAQISNYAYSTSENCLWFNLYGSSKLSTTLSNGSVIKLTQETNYPWEGNIKINIEEAQNVAFHFRIPEWASGAKILVNGKETSKVVGGSYALVNKQWKKGDVVNIILPMQAKLIEANPLVEETRNQVAVKRGPVVYCLESIDLPKGAILSELSLPAKATFTPKILLIDNSKMMALVGLGLLTKDSGWKNKLYKEVSTAGAKPVNVRLIPYYAWANRGRTEMSVWLPLSR